jgi:hypothetical protein
MKPLSKGGEDTPENRVYLCKNCHQSLSLHHTTFGMKGIQGNVGTFYVGAYKPYWEKLKEMCSRERVSVSKIVNELIVDYVTKHDPGNPQRPLTAYAPGHEDEQALRMQEAYARLVNYAADNGGNIPRTRIVRELGAHLAGRPKVDAVDRMEQRLIEDGVKVWR